MELGHLDPVGFVDNADIAQAIDDIGSLGILTTLPFQGNRTLFMHTEHFHKEGTGYCGFRAIQSVDAGIQRSVSRMSMQEDLIALGIVRQILQECFSLQVLFLYIDFKGLVDLADGGDRLIQFIDGNTLFSDL